MEMAVGALFASYVLVFIYLFSTCIMYGIQVKLENWTYKDYLIGLAFLITSPISIFLLIAFAVHGSCK